MMLAFCARSGVILYRPEPETEAKVHVDGGTEPGVRPASTTAPIVNPRTTTEPLINKARRTPRRPLRPYRPVVCVRLGLARPPRSDATGGLPLTRTSRHIFYTTLPSHLRQAHRSRSRSTVAQHRTDPGADSRVRPIPRLLGATHQALSGRVDSQFGVGRRWPACHDTGDQAYDCPILISRSPRSACPGSPGRWAPGHRHATPPTKGQPTRPLPTGPWSHGAPLTQGETVSPDAA